jgi:hypothetical protein
MLHSALKCSCESSTTNVLVVLTYTESVFQSELIQIKIIIPSPLLMTIDQTQPENVKYFNCLASKITNDAKVHMTLNAGFPWQKQL